VQLTLEFQVVEGGKNDVDCKVEDPKQRVLYEVKKKNYDTYQTMTKIGGEYKICFSNEFSTFTHKIVYFDLQVGEDDDARLWDPEADKKDLALQQTEMSTVTVYNKLKSIIDFQTHHRLKEVSERHFAEGLRDRVQLYSLLQFVIMITVSLVQVLIVRSFFNAIAKRNNRT
jgi:protein ERP2